MTIGAGLDLGRTTLTRLNDMGVRLPRRTNCGPTWHRRPTDRCLENRRAGCSRHGL